MEVRVQFLSYMLFSLWLTSPPDVLHYTMLNFLNAHHMHTCMCLDLLFATCMPSPVLCVVLLFERTLFEQLSVTHPVCVAHLVPGSTACRCAPSALLSCMQQRLPSLQLGLYSSMT